MMQATVEELPLPHGQSHGSGLRVCLGEVEGQEALN
jgi:hypothetical protein